MVGHHALHGSHATRFRDAGSLTIYHLSVRTWSAPRRRRSAPCGRCCRGDGGEGLGLGLGLRLGLGLGLADLSRRRSVVPEAKVCVTARTWCVTARTASPTSRSRPSSWLAACSKLARRLLVRQQLRPVRGEG
eukprot:scaffold12297_cov57-Phaeocystis_antarctica.AAC.1